MENRDGLRPLGIPRTWGEPGNIRLLRYSEFLAACRVGGTVYLWAPATLAFWTQRHFGQPSLKEVSIKLSEEHAGQDQVSLPDALDLYLATLDGFEG